MQRQKAFIDGMLAFYDGLPLSYSQCEVGRAGWRAARERLRLALEKPRSRCGGYTHGKRKLTARTTFRLLLGE